ncbi:hypothetical protein pb186bvf_020581 [Paramecium bursaria]
MLVLTHQLVLFFISILVDNKLMSVWFFTIPSTLTKLQIRLVIKKTKKLKIFFKTKIIDNLLMGYDQMDNFKIQIKCQITYLQQNYYMIYFKNKIQNTSLFIRKDKFDPEKIQNCSCFINKINFKQSDFKSIYYLRNFQSYCGAIEGEKLEKNTK